MPTGQPPARRATRATPKKTNALRMNTATLRQKIMDSVWGFTEAQAVLSANEVGLFDALVAGPRTVPSLARNLKCDRRAVGILADALTAMGLLNRRREKLSLDPAARALFNPESPAYLGYSLQHQKRLYDHWGKLAQVVRTGVPVARPRRTQTDQRRFLMAMIGASQPSIASLLALVDLQRVETFLDLGGGLGHYAVAVAMQWPKIRCTLFDIPPAIRLAKPYLAEQGWGDRIGTIAGDARTADLGGPYDVILISNVIHMFSHADSVRLLKCARKALAPGGKIYLKDFYLRNDRKGPLRAAQFGLNMLVNTEAGSVFTEEDYRLMIARAGLKRTRIHPLGEASWVLVLKCKP